MLYLNLSDLTDQQTRDAETLVNNIIEVLEGQTIQTIIAASNVVERVYLYDYPMFQMW